MLLSLLLVAQSSQLTFHGVASLHSFDAKVERFSGEAEAAQGLTSGRGKIEIDVKSIDTGIKGRNEEMFKLLEPEKFPKMIFTLETAEELPNKTEDGRVIDDLASGETKCGLKGKLVVLGKSAPVKGSGVCRRLPGGGWQVEGEAPVDMTAYGIKPPSVAFISMDPVVKVTYKLLFKR